MKFNQGILDAAAHRPAHPGRIGGPITPCAITVHTTDMPPEDFGALVASWQEHPAAGDCAHFVIGRTPADGLVQMVPISHNANHAGGPRHGWFVDAKGNQWHPNELSVGIEIHCAGRVRKNSFWRCVDGSTLTGAAIPASDVISDPEHPGYGWHCVTDWQYQQLEALITALFGVMAPVPTGLHAVSPSQTPAPWAVLAGRVCGHCSLDFAEREDPHQPTMQWLRALYGSST